MPKKKEQGAGKKDDKGSKKTQKKQQEKIIEDRTFGLKNKNKSAKVQKYVQGVARQVKGMVGKGGEQAQYDKEQREKAEKRKIQEKEELIASLFKSVNNVKQQQPKDGEDSKSILCAFFKAGLCKKGDKCKFSHDLNIEKRSAKADLYTDIREITESENMANWDQEQLEKVINENNKKRGPASSTIVCKHFLDAVETKTYGWFWQCPNGEGCQYRHCLPPGYVLKRDKEKALEKVEERRIEEIIDAERDELLKRPNLTPVTLESFKAWKVRKQQEREKRIAEEMKKESRKLGGKVHNMLNGRALFKFDPSAFKDDDEAIEDYGKEPDDLEQKETGTAVGEQEVAYKEWNTSAQEEHNLDVMIEEARKAASKDQSKQPEESKYEEEKVKTVDAHPQSEQANPREEKNAEAGEEDEADEEEADEGETNEETKGEVNGKKEED
eukprot:TRINITY_DN3537_c0_g1_i5.p1 TRINITY_DN3537_c0_g1~~TRINITY_DN3537_c0_g1_i5.p1  ORF type:complete len:440 (+),score=193.84 TRINITY_DN3537_c0_g1_i5:183-1502(+)